MQGVSLPIWIHLQMHVMGELFYLFIYLFIISLFVFLNILVLLYSVIYFIYFVKKTLGIKRDSTAQTYRMLKNKVKSSQNDFYFNNVQAKC